MFCLVDESRFLTVNSFYKRNSSHLLASVSILLEHPALFDWVIVFGVSGGYMPKQGYDLFISFSVLV